MHRYRVLSQAPSSGGEGEETKGGKMRAEDTPPPSRVCQRMYVRVLRDTDNVHISKGAFSL
jgi:hypothetical protein